MSVRVCVCVWGGGGGYKKTARWYLEHEECVCLGLMQQQWVQLGWTRERPRECRHDGAVLVRVRTWSVAYVYLPTLPTLCSAHFRRSKPRH